MNSSKKVFTNIYHNKKWSDPFSHSGTGSNLIQTEKIRRDILLLVELFSIKTIVDAPCGDFFWMKEIKNELAQKKIQYLGLDVVSEIISFNIENHSDNYFNFKELDITKDPIPKSDLIICRDCLVHLSFADIFKTLRNFKKSKSKYILTTTFVKRKKNIPIHTGDWRSINLQTFPFNFKNPILLINENSTEPTNVLNDKCLVLYEIKSMNLSFFKFKCLLNSLINFLRITINKIHLNER